MIYAKAFGEQLVVQRLAVRGRNVVAAPDTPSVGRTLFDAALRGGSQALGVAGVGLAAGQPADIVALTPRGSVSAGDRPTD